MPDEVSSQTPSGDTNPPPPPPPGLTIEQRVMALESKSSSKKKDKKPNDFLQDTRLIQVLTIAVNAATLIATIVIACIYYGQLTQMRLATEAATKAANFASEGLQQSDNQFGRTVRQLIYQTVSQAESAKGTQQAAGATQSAAQTARDTLTLDQRPWVGLTGFHEIPDTSPEAQAEFARLMGSQGRNINIRKTEPPMLQNTGKTPARSAKVYWGIFNPENSAALQIAISNSGWMEGMIESAQRDSFHGFSAKQIPEGIDSNMPRNTADTHFWVDHLDDRSFFPPGTGTKSKLPIPEIQIVGVLPPDQRVSLESHRFVLSDERLIVFGKVVYQDVWGSPHETTFCNYMVQSIKRDFSVCPAFNDMK